MASFVVLNRVNQNCRADGSKSMARKAYPENSDHFSVCRSAHLPVAFRNRIHPDVSMRTMARAPARRCKSVLTCPADDLDCVNASWLHAVHNPAVCGPATLQAVATGGDELADRKSHDFRSVTRLGTATNFRVGVTNELQHVLFEQFP